MRTMLDLPVPATRAFTVVRAETHPERLEAYAALRRRAFVDEQHLFRGHDLDAHDGAPPTRVLVALDEEEQVIGGVRLHPVAAPAPAARAAHWRGSRLVCSGAGSPSRGLVGALLVRRACVEALAAGATHFDATVQARYRHFFARLGWDDVRAVDVAGAEHRLMVWPIPTTLPEEPTP
ncbi:MAG: synthase [Solirubrobacterales bacterium]|nr:synthase [Solirubrobacterales bacterium]